MQKPFFTCRLPLLLICTLFTGAVLAEGHIHEVIIPEGQHVFLPETVTISVGDTVRWVNNDYSQDSHDFASVPGPNPENKEIKIIELRPGQTAEHQFNTAGTYRYFCYIHKDMVGTIIVE